MNCFRYQQKVQRTENVLCFVFCVLCFVFCVLCFVFCVLYYVSKKQIASPGLLTNLSASSGTLSPAFASSTYAYTSVTASANQSTVVVSATTAQASSKLFINNQEVASGVASSPISVPGNANTTIPIYLYSSDYSTVLGAYFVSVSRPTCK